MFIPPILVRRLLLFSLVGFLIFLVFSMRSTYRSRGEVSSTPTGQEADVEIGPFSFVQAGRKGESWKITSSHAKIFEREHRAILTGVDAILHTDRGDEINLQGDEALMDTESRDFSLKKEKGLMKVKLNKDYTIETSGLEWLNGQRSLIAKGEVSLHGDHLAIRGDHLTVALDGGLATVYGNVRTSID